MKITSTKFIKGIVGDDDRLADGILFWIRLRRWGKSSMMGVMKGDLKE